MDCLLKYHCTLIAEFILLNINTQNAFSEAIVFGTLPNNLTPGASGSYKNKLTFFFFFWETLYFLNRYLKLYFSCIQPMYVYVCVCVCMCMDKQLNMLGFWNYSKLLSRDIFSSFQRYYCSPKPMSTLIIIPFIYGTLKILGWVSRRIYDNSTVYLQTCSTCVLLNFYGMATCMKIFSVNLLRLSINLIQQFIFCNKIQFGRMISWI